MKSLSKLIIAMALLVPGASGIDAVAATLPSVAGVSVTGSSTAPRVKKKTTKPKAAATPAATVQQPAEETPVAAVEPQEPQPTEVQEPRPEPDEQTVEVTTITHTIKKGETFVSIAKSYGIPVERLIRDNLEVEKCEKGKVLVINQYPDDIAQNNEGNEGNGFLGIKKIFKKKDGDGDNAKGNGFMGVKSIFSKDKRTDAEKLRDSRADAEKLEVEINHLEIDLECYGSEPSDKNAKKKWKKQRDKTESELNKKRGQLDDAYSTIIDIAPDYTTFYKRGMLKMRQRKHRQAMKDLNKVLAYDDVPLSMREECEDSLSSAQTQHQAFKDRRANTWKAIGAGAATVVTVGIATLAAITGNASALPSGSGLVSDVAGGSSGGSSSASGGGSGKNKCKTCLGTGHCSITGNKKNACHGSKLCGWCNGTGWLDRPESTCQACHGSKKCKTCKGTGNCTTCNGKGYI